MSSQPHRTTGETVLPAGIPEHNPDDPAENAVVVRLAGNWQRRAGVKRDEPDLDALFDIAREDYPEQIVPFRKHPTFLALPPETRSRLMSWAWVNYNRTTVMLEGQVVNPAFQLGVEGYFPQAKREFMQRALAQAMVDEQYHTLMHLNANAVTRRKRGYAFAEDRMPLPLIAREHHRLREAEPDHSRRSLISLAFATVAEISINAYLNLLADDPEIQPVNSATVRLHNRDEYCHASIAGVLAQDVYAGLDGDRKRFFLDSLVAGLEAFVSTDYDAWHAVMADLEVPGGHEMLRELQADVTHKRLVQDFTGLHKLTETLGVTDQLDFDWSRSLTDTDADFPAL